MLIKMLRKDILVAYSYKLSFFSQFIFTFFQIILIYLVSDFIGVIGTDYEKDLNYFQYVIFGICFIDVMITITTYCPREVLNYKLTGIFEEIISININKVYTTVVGMGFYSIFLSLIKILIYIIVSSILLDDLIINLKYSFEFILTTSLLIFSFLMVSIIASAYTIFLHRVGFISTVFLLISIILGNAYFPNTYVPDYLHFLSYLTTFTPGIDNLRMIQLDSFIMFDFYWNIILMIILNIIYFILGYILINKSMRQSKKNGSLLQY